MGAKESWAFALPRICIFALLGLLHPSDLKAAQNLVRNGDFEQINPLNTAIHWSQAIENGAAMGWSGSSTELFSGLSGSSMGPLPYSPPAGGQNYAGVALQVQTPHMGWREFLFGELTTPLIPGIRYELSMHVARHMNSESNFVAKNLGISFQDSNFNGVNYLNYNCVSNGMPWGTTIFPTLQPALIEPGYVDGPAGQWIALQRTNYIANGTESKVVVGVLDNAVPYTQGILQPSNYPAPPPMGPPIHPTAYYLIDNVRVQCHPDIVVQLPQSANSAVCGEPIPLSFSVSNANSYQIQLEDLSTGTLHTLPAVQLLQTYAHQDQFADLRTLFPSVNFCGGGNYSLAVRATCHSLSDFHQVSQNIGIAGPSAEIAVTTNDEQVFAPNSGEVDCGYPVSVSGSLVNASYYYWSLQDLDQAGNAIGALQTTGVNSTQQKSFSSLSVANLKSIFPGFKNATGKKYKLSLHFTCCDPQSNFESVSVQFALGYHDLDFDILGNSIHPPDHVFDENEIAGFQFLESSFPNAQEFSWDFEMETLDAWSNWKTEIGKQVRLNLEGSHDYRATLTAKDADGCVGIRTKPFSSVLPAQFIPNAFSPNGDGNNDVFRVFANDILIVSFKVFNRWGELIFSDEPGVNSAKNPDEVFWDGNYRGENSPSGVYVYEISTRTRYEGKQKDVSIRKGSVTLIR